MFLYVPLVTGALKPAYLRFALQVRIRHHLLLDIPNHDVLRGGHRSGSEGLLDLSDRRALNSREPLVEAFCLVVGIYMTLPGTIMNLWMAWTLVPC